MEKKLPTNFLIKISKEPQKLKTQTAKTTKSKKTSKNNIFEMSQQYSS
jgi:hypothetical protein